MPTTDATVVSVPKITQHVKIKIPSQSPSPHVINSVILVHSDSVEKSTRQLPETPQQSSPYELHQDGFVTPPPILILLSATEMLRRIECTPEVVRELRFEKEKYHSSTAEVVKFCRKNQGKFC